MKSSLRSYIDLTKPRVMVLVVLSAITALFLEGSAVSHPIDALLIILGIYLAGGSANALNQYFEREIDARMSRTRTRRPLPLGNIRPLNALVFAITIGLVSIALFGLIYNWLSALLALGTILFYGFFYTLWLKPNTDQNIVIGGAAGAMAPLIAWAAATGSLSLTPAILFLIVFIWTPPHFWALALYFKDDYKKVGLPMLPIVRGEKSTLNQIFFYTIALFAVSLGLLAVNAGPIYAIAAILLGGIFIKKAHGAKSKKSRELQWALFGYSVVYLFGLFFAMIIDSFI
ncbi:MAG: protoheme IX farnesyltransferase [candidate division Zixibacteria bacterium]|nr:protoheme IX farnesyltransferase [candidate division Zixibacteria bacterium]NIR64536.1 protoheme IX farnesyltransferase [candidate division Zixibacteria bacterium]NIS16605.1 protoheme IX farnesyltransferase [candidate division Zixibacteria bacterium]NIT52967.1 protoheme IX farnesyltransferase [candidate division Zixibacteria bacterium]NIX56587.1 protoheme IX farnesyltransferase [candidate division Zixibacteria bacterium]